MNKATHNGYVTEQRFVLAAMQQGYVVSKPVTNAEHYDFVVHSKHQFYAVQVKKAYLDKKNRWVVELRSRYPRSTKRMPLHETVDVLVVYCSGRNGFYVIPYSEVKDKKSNICVSEAGKYGKYFEDWSL